MTPVEVKVVPRFDAIVLPMRGSYAQHDQAIARLYRELQVAGISPIGSPFGLYLNNPAQVSEEQIRWEVGFPIAATSASHAKVAAPFERRTFEPQLVAITRSHGPFEEGGRYWPVLQAWMAAHGYQPVGAVMVIWHGALSPNGLDARETELRVPVVKISLFALLLRYLVCVWGVCIFILFLFIYLRRAPAHLLPLRVGRLWALFSVSCAIIYFHPLFTDVVYLYGGRWLGGALGFANIAVLVVASFIPALFAHLFLRIEQAHLAAVPLFGAAVLALYAAAVGFILRALGLGPAGWVEAFGSTAATGLVAGGDVLVASMVLVARARDKNAARRTERRVYLALTLASLAISAFQLVWSGPLGAHLSATAALAMPILLLLAVTYFHERALLFDVVAKRGVFALAILVAVNAYFAFVPAALSSVRLGWVGSWLFPISLLPLFMLAPWAYAQLSSRIDHYCFGRKLSSAEAQRFFLAGVGAATSEGELVQAAEARLSMIFSDAGRPLPLQRGARVLLGSETSATVTSGGFEAPIVSRGEVLGIVRVETPPAGRPFLSEDRKLVWGLADALGFALENLRLRDRKLEQERREQELTLLASRAELKALRAQINPHFLFNALNSIAALIASAPAQAEATVERLAEIFRYTLRRADNEWVRVDEEIAFVSSYLELERTRFGQRLGVHLDIEQAAKEALVPAMIVQTLVENAVKHGIAALREQGMIEIRVRHAGEQLRVEVCDSGPGFSAKETSGAGDDGRGHRHGLRNAQDRLRGHFGKAASLEVGRDEARSMTVVRIVMPFIAVAPCEVGGRSC